uniref:Uncharacterized protein n=1 Tax=Globisporangium ultimum (strain ATCC 200006 / CBS 805.95 / DAOM BR144) TaxID=431595 RepID=K3X2N9_GLOUD
MYGNPHANYGAMPPPQPPPSNPGVQRLYEKLAQLKQEKGEADGMLQILRAKLSEAEEDNFDLRANMVTVEAEISYSSKQNEEKLKKEMASMMSQLNFLNDKLKNAERAKLRALREVEELQQKQFLEQKRLDAEKRLLATKKRKHESVMIAASQSLMSRMQSSQSTVTLSQSSVVPSTPSAFAPKPTTAVAIQTELQEEAQGYAQENAELVSKLMTSFSRDLLTLFHGTNGLASASDEDTTNAASGTRPPTPTVAQHSSGSSTQPIGFSQSVFSQIAGQAHAQAQASLLTFAMETNLTQATFATERAKDLYDTLGKMLHGQVTVVALAPVFVKYLAAPTDLDVEILSSVMRVLYFIMHHSERFQQFLLVSGGSTSESSSTSGGLQSATSSSPSNFMDHHPRISLPGLKFASLDEYLASRNDKHKSWWDDDQPHSSAESASELKQQRAKLLSALCRVVKNNVNQPIVVENGLCVLGFWVDLGIAIPSSQPDFKPLLTGNVIQDILLAPKSLPYLKCKALNLLAQLLHFRDIFPEVEASAKKSLLFNRCAKMLLPPPDTTTTTANNNNSNNNSGHETKLLQLQIVHTLLTIVTSFPSTGIRFVLEATRGHPNDADGHRSVIYYMAQLLHHETSEARITSTRCGDASSSALQRLLDDDLRVTLVHDTFTLLSFLVRYVDLGNELDGASDEHAFLSVLYLLSTQDLDHSSTNASISKTAKALLGMMEISG